MNASSYKDKNSLVIHETLTSYDNGCLIFHFADTLISLVQAYTVEKYSVTTKTLVMYNSFRLPFIFVSLPSFPFLLADAANWTTKCCVTYNFPLYIPSRFIVANSRNPRKTCHTTTKPLTWKSTYQEYTPFPHLALHYANIMQVLQIGYISINKTRPCKRIQLTAAILNLNHVKHQGR